MPAITQPTSEKLTKLKLFLEKTKTEFVAQNPDLVEWMNDRKLHVDRLSFSNVDVKNEQIKIDSVESELVEKLATIKNSDTPLASKISEEEYNSILQKIIQLLHLPAGQLEEDSELYLEQQLSDLLGFDITANLNNHRLLFSTGIMESAPHLKRSPTDTLEAHSNYHEAGINRNRSAFGWFGSNTELDQQAVNREKYYISVPLYFNSDWSLQQSELKSWYKFKKIVVINPAEKIAVVGVIGDIGPTTYTRRQFAGSPELIHAGKIWSPQTCGRVLVLFVDDPENKVALGPVYFDSLFNKEPYGK
ncbi:hypothetical protein KA017_03485 [Candidatus Woesebacteria bacterium]|nr:hypothetical protein [Candidatus Woesebacteria bacterium]